MINLQILCKECHFEKTQEEQQNQEYVKTSETMSSESIQSNTTRTNTDHLSKITHRQNLPNDREPFTRRPHL